ncbi:App1 family protein [Pedobacter jamesrossensis]|uniref:App1 family protein n=1 Tax=Pedobacter jamesrossensis TaxID=1908238 RepID=A0ABV8NIQ4_9SPHI
MNKSASVKIYHGYGHTHNLVVYGHVFKRKAKTEQIYSDNLFTNIVHLLKLFILKPFAFIEVRLHFFGQTIHNKTEADGFFKFEWEAEKDVAAGWHAVKVEVLNENGVVLTSTEGEIFVPHITQYAFISDVDDTVMISHSATIGRRLRELFIKNPHTRKTFPDAANHYQQLALSHTNKEQPNPFFYVSSSEWNLYDYLVETFRYNNLPDGAFLLNTLKRWKDLIRTGKTGHEGKLLRVMRILDAFPNQKFVFFGDNSQHDPEIYTSIADKYPKNIEAIYIRNIRPEKEIETKNLLAKVDSKGIKTFLFKNSSEAIEHSKSIGLIQ